MLYPNARTDGGPLTASSSPLPAFIGHIDEPVLPETSGAGLSTFRVRGWVASTRGKPMRARVNVDGRTIEALANEPRPEVVEELDGSFGAISADCGFTCDVPLPDPGTSSPVIRLLIEVGDDEFVTRREFSVAIGNEPAPVRADYKTTWDRTAHDVESAKVAVAGSTDEEMYRKSARATATLLEETVGIHPTDEICEIGCGVGRMGLALAPRCRRWVGCDVSPRMLEHARARLRGLDNVELVELSGWDLAPIPSTSLDVVYCTVVFMHLDEWERYSYVREARRVLRPGGRLYVDNFNLCGEEGWALFLQVADLHPLARPPNVSKSSTPAELGTYLRRAGFEDVDVQKSGELWVHATGRAP